jgi:hypothetical protein
LSERLSPGPPATLRPVYDCIRTLDVEKMVKMAHLAQTFSAINRLIVAQEDRPVERLFPVGILLGR